MEDLPTQRSRQASLTASHADGNDIRGGIKHKIRRRTVFLSGEVGSDEAAISRLRCNFSGASKGVGKGRRGKGGGAGLNMLWAWIGK